ncbi:MAG: hypothetical protein NWF04_10670 [Candidatus Bathyarchaeota archaeon]|nr:hypothetical protein [Candidatus Bathyarchaeota archaeon]
MRRSGFVGFGLFSVAVAFLLYGVYQAVVTSVFLCRFSAGFPSVMEFVETSHPALQTVLILVQEFASSVGIYLRLIAGVFGVYAAVLFVRGDGRWLGRFGVALFFEALYFAFLIPSGINHVVGSQITSGIDLNLYTAASFLLQAALISPPLLILSRKIRKNQSNQEVLRWFGVAAPLYVLGLWVKHALLWTYALLPLGDWQGTAWEVLGAANSVSTLLAAAVVCAVACLPLIQRKTQPNPCLLGTALMLIACYVIVYAAVAVWVPVYNSFAPLIELWLAAALILGAAVITSKGRGELF